MVLTRAGKGDRGVVDETEEVRVFLLAENIEEGKRHDENANDDIEGVQISDERAAHVIQHQLKRKFGRLEIVLHADTCVKSPTSSAGASIRQHN